MKQARRLRSSRFFWRRGARHSKDKARDDSGKLVPMRDTYPTARFLSIAASGEFTEPAKTLVRSRDIELFYVPKSNIIEAFNRHGLVMDYPDSSAEELKAHVARTFGEHLTEEKKKEVAITLFDIIGQATVDAYTSKVRGFLAASPREIRFIETSHSDATTFNSIEEATDFLESPSFTYSGDTVAYKYEVTYSDGYEFSREINDLVELKDLHQQLEKLHSHMEMIAKRKRTQ